MTGILTHLDRLTTVRYFLIPRFKIKTDSQKPHPSCITVLH